MKPMKKYINGKKPTQIIQITSGVQKQIRNKCGRSITELAKNADSTPSNCQTEACQSLLIHPLLHLESTHFCLKGIVVREEFFVEYSHAFDGFDIFVGNLADWQERALPPEARTSGSPKNCSESGSWKWAARFLGSAFLNQPEVGFSCVTGKAKLSLLPISAELQLWFVETI